MQTVRSRERCLSNSVFCRNSWRRRSRRNSVSLLCISFPCFHKYLKWEAQVQFSWKGPLSYIIHSSPVSPTISKFYLPYVQEFKQNYLGRTYLKYKHSKWNIHADLYSTCKGSRKEIISLFAISIQFIYVIETIRILEM